MAETATHRITMPKRVSNLLARRAKAGNTTLSGAFLALVEDALDEISDEEDRRLSAICDERIRTSTVLIPLEEIMGKYDAL
ncbi:MAG: hypothetical protein FWG50_00910 [Kiritimatiellaeota bacterium]|nr:hypothetical protein [Kiritimatiellota bacterium]